MMYYLLVSLHYIGVFCITIWQFIQPIVSSPTFVAALLVVFLAPWLGIKSFLKQQRISRIQRIYYEESLLDQLKHLDNAVEITSKNLAYFENAINLILNDFKMDIVTSLTIMSLNEIAKQISSPIIYQSSKREVLITLFKRYGYTMHRWLFKLDNDFSKINLYIREVLFSLAVKLQLNPRISEQTIMSYGEEIKDLFELVMRHYTFIFLFNEIVSRVGTLDFKSQEELINNVVKDKRINSILSRIDESFQILFGYFKLEDKVLLSYLKDENNCRFKLHIGETISIERVEDNYSIDPSKMRIIKDDMQLSNVKVEINNSMKHYSVGECSFNCVTPKLLINF